MAVAQRSVAVATNGNAACDSLPVPRAFSIAMRGASHNM
jgi:hypothetical protein